MNRIGIDFGTSNTAAAVMVAGRPYVVPLSDGERTQPTAVFFDGTRRETVFGNAALAALVDGREGRFMRALKSVLGTPLMREKRVIQHERLTLVEVVARFLARVKTDAETHCGTRFDAVMSGRPVTFHTAGSERDRQAELDLREAYGLAGFSAVDFLFEPEAAAIASGGVSQGLGLVVDIGGGTSDFTLFRGDPGRVEVVASHGIRLGGTDFDRMLSLAKVMPLLGMGTDLRAEFGPAQHPAPNALFHDLAAWEKIPFLYTAETRRAVARMAKVAVDQAAFARLVTVLDMEIGHDVALSVERGKIGANRAAPGWGAVDLGLVERGLERRITGQDLTAILGPEAARIRQAAVDTLTLAGVAPDAVSKVVMVGGSSLLGVVEAAIADLLPRASVERGDAFTGVVDGLAIAAAG